MNEKSKGSPSTPSVACDGVTWGRCGALGAALREASEAKRQLEKTEDALKRSSEALLAERLRVRELEEAYQNVQAGQPRNAVPHAASCPNCNDTRYTTRGLRAAAVQEGWVICAHCYSRWRTR